MIAKVLYVPLKCSHLFRCFLILCSKSDTYVLLQISGKLYALEIRQIPRKTQSRLCFLYFWLYSGWKNLRLMFSKKFRKFFRTSVFENFSRRLLVFLTTMIISFSNINLNVSEAVVQSCSVKRFLNISQN